MSKNLFEKKTSPTKHGFGKNLFQKSSGEPSQGVNLFNLGSNTGNPFSTSGKKNVEAFSSKPLPPLKIKYNNRVKKIANVPNTFQKFENLVKKKYQEFSQGKHSYKVCYLDNEDDQIDISDDEDYDVFLQFVTTARPPSVKLFLNSKAEGRGFDREIDDCETVNESILGDTMLGSTVDRPSLMTSPVPPPGYDFSKIEEYKKEIEMLKFEVEKNKIKNQLLEEKSKIVATKKEIAKQKKAVKKVKKGSNKSKKGKVNKNKKPKPVATIFDQNQDLIDIKDPEVHPNIEMEYKSLQSESSDDEHHSKKNESGSEVEMIQKKPETNKVFDSDKEEEPLKSESDGGYNPCESDSPKPRQNDSFELIDDRPREFSDSKHEHAIQPVIEKPIEKIQKKILCQQCKRDLTEDTRFICSIRDNYTLCELCEMHRNDGYVFIKIPKGVEFNFEVYDKFCQKMLGIYEAPSYKLEECQYAIMNTNKRKDDLKIGNMLKKKAQILNKERYREGVPFELGGFVTLNWEVKNMIHKAWSENMIFICSNDSDLTLNEQRIDSKLGAGQKGEINLKFKMPKDINGKVFLTLKMYLFDLDEQKAIGEPFVVNLVKAD
ncbi:unnamed protein product [Moneuplotes crassus]|uniref:PB1 domain-containing protein n=1 Tax=Euplotes crassus TaxID=5936 RepID=A0AAD1U9Y7_EUPCR|nr:unnamed protein product [Moneuplotes crassus]